MKHSSDISEELQLISPTLANAGKGDCFTVPEGYFTWFPQYMLDRNRFLELVPGSLELPYSLPAGYFEHLAENIVARIEIEEELSELPMLESIGKRAPYQLPTGYFDTKVAIPVDDTTIAAPAKLRSIKGYRRILQYAAAAMLAGVLVTGAFTYTDSKNHLSGQKPAATISVDPNATETVGIAPQNQPKDMETMVGEKKAPGFVKQVQALTEDEMKKYLDENAPAEPIQIIEEGEEGENTK